MIRKVCFHYNLSRIINLITFPQKKNNDPENVVNSKYYDIDQMQTLKFPNIHESLALFPINACCLNKKFYDLDHILKCKNIVVDIIAVSETRNYAIEFTPTESSAGTRSFTLLVTCLIKLVLILIFIKLTS